MADYHMEDLVYELNFEGANSHAELLMNTKNVILINRVFVAGVLGPTSKTASISPDVNDPGFRNVTFDTLVTAYVEAMRGLINGGADIILIETIFDTLNAKAAVFAVDQYFETN